jgi:hypothetical protein
MEQWEPAERVQKNAAGEYRAFIGGEWVPVENAQKNSAGQFRVSRKYAREYDTNEDWKRRTALSSARAEHPVRAGAVDLLAGMTSIPRGVLNALTPKITPESRQLGDVIWPADQAGDSIFRTFGELLDPSAWAIGIGAAKALPYAKVLGHGFKEGVKAFGKNIAGGAATGGTIGGLSDRGDAETGAKIGAALNVTLPPALRATGTGISKLVTLASPKDKAAAVVREVAGADLPALKAASAAAPKGVTAAQSVTGVQNDLVDALDAFMRRRDITNYFSRLDRSQRQAQIADLRKLAGGATQTEAITARGTSKDALNKLTGRMREIELEAANLAAHGLFPLDTGRVVGNITRKLNDPSSGVSDINRKVLTAVGKKIEEWTERGGGVIDAKALYEIRKSVVNDTVERLMKGAKPSVIARRAASLLAEVKPFIDDAIEAAGGTGWRAYLNTFEQGARLIDQRTFGAKALDLFEKSPNTFESLAAGNEPAMVRKIFATEHDLGKAMAGQEAPIQKVAAELARDRMIKEGAARGQGGLESILESKFGKWVLPNWINAKIAVTNRILTALETRLSKKTLNELENAMKTGEGFNALLTRVPANERVAIAKALADAQMNPLTRGAIGGIASASDQ